MSIFLQTGGYSVTVGTYFADQDEIILDGGQPVRWPGMEALLEKCSEVDSLSLFRNYNPCRKTLKHKKL